ncbi:MAG: dipeptide epimerase [Planctomycetes bacterium]|nr:dipeptide epimerase [Planctomycetota bacterium]
MKLDSYETWTEKVPLTRPYTVAYERVEAVELDFVRLRAGKHEGLGCASPILEVTGESFEACRAALAAGPEAIPASCPAARAAVDMALHDLRARSAGKPLVEHLGRVHRELPTSITIGIKDSLAEVLAEAEEYEGRGFRILKVKIGLDLEQDFERLRKLHERFGTRLRMRIDANQGYRAGDLARLFALVEQLEIEFVEQPLPPAHDGELDSLSARERARLALESVLGPAEARRNASRCGIFNIKLMKCGGVTPALEIARVADEHGQALMWGCSDESRIGIAAALHAAFACRATRYLDLDGHLDLARDPARGGFTIQEGVLRLTDAPGLGVELEPAR